MKVGGKRKEEKWKGAKEKGEKEKKENSRFPQLQDLKYLSNHKEISFSVETMCVFRTVLMIGSISNSCLCFWKCKQGVTLLDIFKIVQFESPEHFRNASAWNTFYPCELFVSDWGCENLCLPSMWWEGAVRCVLRPHSLLPALVPVGPVTVHPMAAAGERSCSARGHKPALLCTASRGKSAQEENHDPILVKWILQLSYPF